jgi:hypothetical protein
MSHYRTVGRTLGRMLLSFGVTMTLFGAGVVPAQADSSFGPWTCCPGQNEGHPQSPGPGCPYSGAGVNWDRNVCHTWWSVYYGHGNVGPTTWDGPDAPPPEATQKPWCGFPFMCSGTP